jgi:hypothetical protein
MLRTIAVADQILEAKRLVSSREASQLRIALILLDGAAETLMYRAIRDRRFLPIGTQQVRRMRAALRPDEFATWKRDWVTEIPHEFPGKVDHLVKNGLLDPQVGGILNAIHRYRNEIQHRDFVRPATIRPAVMVLFDIVTSFLLVLPVHRSLPSPSSARGHAPFSFRHGLSGLDDLKGDTALQRSLRSGVVVGNISGLLSAHLVDRLRELKSGTRRRRGTLLEQVHEG